MTSLSVFVYLQMSVVPATLLVGGAAFVASMLTQAGLSGDWYECISPQSPPNWLFGTMWTVLYIQQIYRLSRSLRWVLHATLLFLQVLWCFLFFHERQPALALGVLIVILLLSIRHLEEFGPLLMGWVSFALALNCIAALRAYIRSATERVPVTGSPTAPKLTTVPTKQSDHAENQAGDGGGKEKGHQI